MTNATETRETIGTTGRFELETETVRVHRAWDKTSRLETRFNVYDTDTSGLWSYSTSRRHYAAGWVDSQEAEYLAESI